MSESPSKVSPIVAIAAVSVILFSVVGIGVMTGMIPSSLSRNEPQPVASVPAKSPAATSAPEKTPPAASARVEKKAPKPVAAVKQRSPEPARVASAEPAPIAAAEPVKPAPAPAPGICADCGTISAINVIEQEGEGSGIGAVAGGVVGGLLGNQVGQGRGRTAATVIGAGAGAYGGHQAEKYIKRTKRWDVAVRMDDGSMRDFPYTTEPAFRVGDKVRVVEGKLVTP